MKRIYRRLRKNAFKKKNVPMAPRPKSSNISKSARPSDP